MVHLKVNADIRSEMKFETAVQDPKRVVINAYEANQAILNLTIMKTDIGNLFKRVK